jgi:hypothetical protein
MNNLSVRNALGPTCCLPTLPNFQMKIDQSTIHRLGRSNNSLVNSEMFIFYAIYSEEEYPQWTEIF